MSIKRIKVISRNPDHYMRETNKDIYKVPRNFDPDLHPLQGAREYKAALNAVKLERVFAKPFVASLSHAESVSVMAKHPQNLSWIYSGTVLGQLHLWNLQSRSCLWETQAHSGQIFNISFASEGKMLFTVGNDKTIKRWGIPDSFQDHNELKIDEWVCDSIITGLSHQDGSNAFVTCGEKILLWDSESKCVQRDLSYGTMGDKHEATAVNICFNAVEKNLFATSDYANNIILYDTRSRQVVKVLKMKLRANALQWNPMEAMMLTAASEDYNCYTFDIRNMNAKNRIVAIHSGHTSAVIDLSYSPTGREFCSGSYDKSVRIFGVEESRSRDVYHTKRMFKINCVLWSGDGRYVASGSTDHNIRLWKARASENLGIMRAREKRAMEYSEELKRKYKAFPEIRRIAKHRHLPSSIYQAKKEHAIIKESTKRKESNRRMHSKPGSVPFPSALEEPIVGLQDEYSIESPTEPTSSHTKRKTKKSDKEKRKRRKSEDDEESSDDIENSDKTET